MMPSIESGGKRMARPAGIECRDGTPALRPTARLHYFTLAALLGIPPAYPPILSLDEGREEP